MQEMKLKFILLKYRIKIDNTVCVDSTQVLHLFTLRLIKSNISTKNHPEITYYVNR